MGILDNLTPAIVAEATLSKEEVVAPHFDSIVQAMVENEINTPYRVAHFLAQCAHESGGFRHTSENLNYSWQALRNVFRRYFPSDEFAQQYHRQPRKIASRVYANRMGNGDEASEDGWFHRGAGFIQLTGHDNQAAYWEAHGDLMPLDREAIVDILSAPPHAARTAGWFWTVNKLNVHADRDDKRAVSGIINVGRASAEPEQINGYDDRVQLTEHCYNTIMA
jgi:putative chitinase